MFAACQLQLGLGFKEIKSVQFQIESIFFFALEGIDLALDDGQLQRQRFGRVKATRCVNAVDLKLVLLI